MRLGSVRTSGAVVLFCLIQFSAGSALGDHGAYSHAVAYDPICTIDGEARCWSPAEVDEALSRIFCDGGSPDKSCFLLEPTRTAAVHGIEDSVRPAAVTPDSPKLDASGVPEFNAFEEGCDD